MKFSLTTRLAALALASLFTAAAHAVPVLNTPNVANLTGWTSAGDVALRSDGTAGLTLSESSLLLSTATTDTQDDFPASAGAFNVSGNNPVAGGSTLETSVGLTPGALDDNTSFHFAMEGSSAWKEFSVLAGDTLKVDWQLFARPDTGTSGIPLPDTAWLVWSQGANTQLFKLADVLSAPMGNTADANGWLSTGPQHYTLNATSNGTARLGFVVADMDSFDTTTVLAVSNVVQTSVVPEPSTVLMVLAGLVMMVFMNRRQNNRRKEG
jgi:hypothetical protein